MPLDNIQKAKSKGLLQTQRQNSAGMITSRYDSDTEGQLPAPFRSKLHHLFGQIEKEFETLYTENLHLQDKVETLQERLDAYMAVDKSINEPLETVDGATKAKRSASHISQKIKKSYIASTSRLVSSFRQAAPAYTVVKSFHGHKDGVWEVNTSKLNPQIIGTASAGLDFFNGCLINFLGLEPYMVSMGEIEEPIEGTVPVGIELGTSWLPVGLHIHYAMTQEFEDLQWPRFGIPGSPANAGRELTDDTTFRLWDFRDPNMPVTVFQGHNQ
ncbi:hypothetical protein DPMN_128147 [Dreissena polymorpha]|uniref:Uncharacterized protein n=1 Tax=Dreissena polymorpha TaxID=45954 RepID=A0A9D4JW46_DREPO|nr:hypothetical protein DPMN_128147 [Dreissena polymorpha]